MFTPRGDREEGVYKGAADLLLKYKSLDKNDLHKNGRVHCVMSSQHGTSFDRLFFDLF